MNTVDALNRLVSSLRFYVASYCRATSSANGKLLATHNGEIQLVMTGDKKELDKTKLMPMRHPCTND